MEPKMNDFTVKKDELIPFIVEEGKNIAKHISDAKQRLGDMYNHKNRFEELYAKFGNPETDPQKFADEYLLILEKKSKVAASLRYAIRDICFFAYSKCLSAKLTALSNKKENVTNSNNN